MKKTILIVSLVLLFLLVLNVAANVYYSIENANLRNQITVLQEEIESLKAESLNKANIVTALGITEVTPTPTSQNTWDRNYSHLWITGWVFNSGLGMAIGVGLNILAYDESNKVLLNETMPVLDNGYIETYAIPPHTNQPRPLTTNIFSQQNMTVIMGIYHEGVFSNSTRYEAIPVFQNP